MHLSLWQCTDYNNLNLLKTTTLEKQKNNKCLKKRTQKSLLASAQPNLCSNWRLRDFIYSPQFEAQWNLSDCRNPILLKRMRQVFRKFLFLISLLLTPEWGWTMINKSWAKVWKDDRKRELLKYHFTGCVFSPSSKEINFVYFFILLQIIFFFLRLDKQFAVHQKLGVNKKSVINPKFIFLSRVQTEST